jgi:hypothetical protein
VRRIFSFTLGLGLGLVLGGNIVRRLDAVQQRFAPDRLGVLASEWVGGARARIVDSVGTVIDRREAAVRPRREETVADVVDHPAVGRRARSRPWTR